MGQEAGSRLELGTTELQSGGKSERGVKELLEPAGRGVGGEGCPGLRGRETYGGGYGRRRELEHKNTYLRFRLDIGTGCNQHFHHCHVALLGCVVKRSDTVLRCRAGQRVEGRSASAP